MKILHIMLSNYYIDGFNYQENVLPELNRLHGHNVLIIASTETFSEHKQLVYLEPGTYSTASGIPVHRIGYTSWLPLFIGKKVRKYKKWLSLAITYKPDVVLWHGLAAWDLRLLARLKKAVPGAKIYLDSHEDFHNSARNPISKYLLHYCLYRFSLQPALKVAEKVLYISEETKLFDKQAYKVPLSLLEFYPLGALVLSEEECRIRAQKAAALYGFNFDKPIFLHSGKMDKSKKTLDLMRAFKRITNSDLRMFLVGSIAAEIKEAFFQLLDEDERISFLGWKSPEELMDLLCACHLYLQPGTQSVTLQNALGVGAPVAIFPYLSHKPYLNGNGFYVENEADIELALKEVAANPQLVPAMRNASRQIAIDILDYQKLAARLYR